MQIKEGEKSFFWAGRYHDNMNSRDTLVTELNVLADFDPVLPESYKDADYVMLGNLTPEIQMKVIRQMNKQAKTHRLGYHEFLDGCSSGQFERSDQ